jgi:hypothetical protein
LFQRGADKLWVYASSPLVAARRRAATFECMGETYPYFTHPYNATWRNERAVEIPIALRFLAQNQGQRVLEVGNVLSYYTSEVDDWPADYHVVDKYERSPGVQNIDFTSFTPSEPYDALLSISTFEHIGWDEDPRDPAKVLRALSHLARVVRNRERVLLTFPLGYHPQLDALASSDGLGFCRSSALMRVNQRNDWREVSVREALPRRYGQRYAGANALFVGLGLKS